MLKGRVIYEKDGQTYTVSDIRFLFLSKKGFSKVVCVPAGHVIHIYINDESISSIKFIDCDFDIFDFGFMSIFIHIQSKNTQVYLDNINYNKHQELFVESQNIIIARNINDSGLLGLKGESILVSSLRNTGLETTGKHVSITDYCSRDDHTFDVFAEQNSILRNVSIVNENKKIEVDVRNLNYYNIQLTSKRINISNVFATSEAGAEEYTVDDDLLKRIKNEMQFDKDQLNSLNIPNNSIIYDIKKPFEKK